MTHDYLGNATYSPDDNKLRLYPFHRLDAATYNRVKSAGFKWAPKQEVFVAPMWTPDREDLLIELCGEIDDEDTSLVERAEQRADRFSDYSDKRGSEADRAHDAVHELAGGIPLGQPILVGHHSERRARKDAQRIDNGIRKAVSLWETAEYWKRRAASALAHAQYKERPDVRARRIKTIEADRRKVARDRDEAAKWLEQWLSCEQLEGEAQLQKAIQIANVCWLHLPRKAGDREDFNQNPSAHSVLTNAYPTLYAPRTVAEVIAVAKETYPRTIAHLNRWLDHYNHRLDYERAMLAEQGGLVAEQADLQVGGKVRISGEWLVILRVNKKGGQVMSVTTNARYVPVRSVEEIQEYQAPTEEQAAKVKKATAIAPLCNYPGEGFVSVTKAQWEAIPKDYKGTHTIEAKDGKGRHRVRTALRIYTSGKTADWNQNHSYPNVFISDAKVVEPKADTDEPKAAVPAPERIIIPRSTTVEKDERGEKFKALQEVKVEAVSAEQLFPTPPSLARRMVEEAGIVKGMSVLEPSGGTGAIIDAILAAGGVTTTTEINYQLCEALRQRYRDQVFVLYQDFLEYPVGNWPVILMNPPFANGQDIAHIIHAFHLLKPGGRLVAICANGPRQQRELMPWVEEHGGTWEPLPDGTFEASGTGVRTVLIVVDR